jgi:hypothetical protein
MIADDTDKTPGDPDVVLPTELVVRRSTCP